MAGAPGFEPGPFGLTPRVRSVARENSFIAWQALPLEPIITAAACCGFTTLRRPLLVILAQLEVGALI